MIIQNSTFAKELGFDVSFAKNLFDEHKRDNIILPCPPLFEKSTKRFLTYTDGYIKRGDDEKAALLQIAYKYKKRKKELKDIQKIVSQNPSIRDIKAYTFGDEGFVHDIILHEFKAYKPSVDEFINKAKDGLKIKQRLKNKNIDTREFVIDNTHLKSIDILTNNILFTNTQIVFSILLDETSYYDELYNMDIWLFISTILTLIAVFVVYKLRTKEIKLSEQDKFIQSSMHEIKTPLSIITLNNQLRKHQNGDDQYTAEIDNALKILKVSYDDMSYAMSKNNANYHIENLSLKEVLKERINFFYTIAKVNKLNIFLDTDDKDCYIDISLIELTRVIDNNISNAIKYAKVGSDINISLKDGKLSFHNFGDPIKDTTKVFNKYFRENHVVGGHGLGLSIVKEITQKYHIDIDVSSNQTDGTKFTYKFECQS